MNYLKSICAVAILSVFAFTGFAQTPTSSDAQADKLLKESQNKFNALKNISATFTYTLSNPSLDQPIQKKGSVHIQKEKYHIKFPEEEFFCDGKHVWVFLKDEEEVTITDYDKEESPSIERIYKIYEEDTRTKYKGVEGSNHKIEVFHLNDESDIWKVELLIDKSTKLISQAKMFGRNGSTYDYKMSDIKTNQALPDDTFVFDAKRYPGMDIYVNNLSNNP